MTAPSPTRADHAAAFDELRRRLLAGEDFAALHAALRDVRNHGLTSESALDGLRHLRAGGLDEAAEDRVLELMDVASGHCVAALRLW